jgi:hypothetical protein
MIKGKLHFQSLYLIIGLCFLLLGLLACKTLFPQSVSSTPTPAKIGLTPFDKAATEPVSQFPTMPLEQVTIPPVMPGLTPVLPQQSQGGVAPGETASRMLSFFPDLNQAAAPNWLQTGSRAVYRIQTATISQDPEGGAASAGYGVYDLVAFDNQVVVTSQKLYLESSSGALTPSIVAYSTGAPGVGEYWVSPLELVDAERAANNELIVARMPITIGSQTFNAVRFEYHPLGGDAEYVWMFDEVSGIMLFYRHAIGAEGAFNRQLSNLTLVSQRQLDLPWYGGSTPDWLYEGGSLKYEGAYNVNVMGSPSASMPYGVVVSFKRVYDSWSEYDISDYLYGRLNTSGTRASGASQILDPLWLPREALNVLEDGQVLDIDPVIGSQLSVSRRGGLVILTESNRAYRASLGYAESVGVLQTLESEVNSGTTTITIILNLTYRD